jgi:DNA-binding transcriptional MerR regulator
VSAPVRSPARMSIGEVLAALRTEFPDVTISKIRFLEAQGLVEPSRTPAGYRQFSRTDVDRLRYVLTAQRDHYLPLKVIKDQVDAIAAGAGPAPTAAGAPPAPQAPAGVTATQERAPAAVRLTRPQMLEQTQLSEASLAQLDESGLLNRRRGGFYDADDVVIAGLVQQLARFGLAPRHLRAFKGAADREVGLIQQTAGTPDRVRTATGRERAARDAEQILELFVQLHATLLRAGVRRDVSS